MKRRNTVRGVLAAVASAVVLMAAAQPALADSSYMLRNSSGTLLGWGYFHADGEKFGVYDAYPDGHSVVVEWTASTKSSYYRCWDSNGAANGPEECDDSIAEGARVTWRVCTAERSTGQLLKCSGWLVDYA